MKSKQELQQIREFIKNKTANRGIVADGATHINVGMDDCGIENGARDVLLKFNEELSDRKLIDVKLTQSGCAGACPLEPLVSVKIGGVKTYYAHVTPEIAVRIIDEHIVGGNPVREFVCSV